jgi:putative GTP pyrophosphokinase
MLHTEAEGASLVGGQQPMSLKGTDPATFLARYPQLGPDALKQSGLRWDDLAEIADHHAMCRSELLPAAHNVVEHLQDLGAVHSIRMRLKDPEHLIEKMIRKALEKPGLTFDLKNYRQRVTDLVGVRALHLFKGDWEEIHHFVKRTWKLHEKPTANHRRGDCTDWFKALGVKTRVHPHGYRSVHYLVRVPSTRTLTVTVELQVRTIFEEGWSEIDHRLRYPYDTRDPVLANFLMVFNTAAGNADEMGTFIHWLKTHQRGVDATNVAQNESYQKTIAELRKQVEALQMKKAQREAIGRELASLSTWKVDSTAPTEAQQKLMNDTVKGLRTAYSVGAALAKIDFSRLLATAGVQALASTTSPQMEAMRKAVEPINAQLDAIRKGFEPVAAQMDAIRKGFEPVAARTDAVLKALEPTAKRTAVLEGIARIASQPAVKGLPRPKK